MATYYPVTLAEMQGFLKKEKGWTQDVQHREVVFNYKLINFPFILIRVYTGIDAGSGNSRGNGNDAIRVCAVNLNNNSGWVKAERVHRVMGWKKNLKARVEKVMSMAKGRLRGTGYKPMIAKVDKILGNKLFKELRAEMEIRAIEGGQQ